VTVQRGDPAGRTSLRVAPVLEAALIDRLRALPSEPAVFPDEEFRAATRARLVALAAVRPPAADAARRPAATRRILRRLLTSAAGSPPLRSRAGRRADRPARR
jgi:hypothetical protein